MSKRIAIITINYNTEDLLEKLINCLMEQNYRDWKLIIVNNSPDNIEIEKVIKKFEDERILLTGINQNLGYSKGNNLGFKYALDKKLISSDDIVLFTNEDIIIEDKGFLDKALNNMEHYKCGFLGPKIINNDGSYMFPHLKEAGYLKCLLHMGNNGKVDNFFGINKRLRKINEPLEVFLLNGACFFSRVNDFVRIGMFDINTFIYYEEELIFRRARREGVKVIYNPGVTVFHEHSASVKKSFSIINKKKFVYDAELYFLTKILNVNSFFKLVFKIERFMEFLILRILLTFKVSG
jgi:hypothetical protein